MTRLAGGNPARRTARRTCSFVLLVALGVALLSAAPVSAGPPPPERGGEVLGRATRSAAPTSPAAAAAVPAGFADNPVFGGLSFPTAIAFAPGGKVFVGEKSGILKVFDSPTDPTATQVVDLRTQVYDVWDRGLLGLAVDPGFGSAGHNFVYVLYTHDHNPLGNPPSWGDGCPTPPGINDDGCTVTGNLSRVPVNPATGVASGPEQPLITDEWCQQYPSHSIGHLDFGPDGNLYVTGGDGASFNNADWGQFGTAGTPTPPNPCGDPPSPVGTPLTPPGAEGGALRSQSPRRPAGQPILLNGAVLRVDPATGNGVAGNPRFNPQSPASNASRIIGYGLRNPFRFTFRPGTPELWIGDVGWGTWEEVNRMTSPTPATAVNFGWPCYEGAVPQPGYQGAGLSQCSSLYDTPGSVAAPYYTYNHSTSVVNGDGCSLSNGSVISAISFYAGGGYPGRYNGALFFGDHSRNCIWAMLPGGNGLPNSNNLQAFVVGGANPVDLKADPVTGDLFYANFEGGQIRRIQFVGANNPPNAVATANPTSGPAPLTVQFNGSGSSDPDGDAITSYSWDLNGDGVYGDSTQANPVFTYTTAATYSVTLRVTDARGASSTSAPIAITVGGGNSAPTPVIDTPPSSLTYAVGDTVSFSGHATDAQDGTLPASALSWRIIIHHGGHTHPPIATFDGFASGSFSAPDHDYPSFLEIQLTATDSGGTQATTSVNIQPRTVNLTFQSNPSGLRLTAGPTTAKAPFTITAVVNARIQLIATSPQKYRGKNYGFVSWSDGGAPTHLITVPSTNATYTATYQRT